VLKSTNRDCTDNIACALRAAAQYGHNDLLEYLISEGSSVDVALPGDNSTLLHVAARSQQTETVKLLLLLGANIDCQDGSGKTPLHVSVETGNFEIIKCLVEHQKTVQSETELQHVVNPERTVRRRNFLNICDVDGNTLLHLGVAAGNINILSYLVSAGSDLNICNAQGDYPLTLAVRCGKNDIVDLLMGGEVQCEEAKFTALTEAIFAGNVETSDFLVRLGAPVNKGETEKPIHIASRLGREEIVSLLLQYGASLTSPNDSGNTALHLASEHGHLSLVKYLVEEERDDLNALNHENETPMHLAVGNGRYYLVT
jgi:ankyrin repeat protein